MACSALDSGTVHHWLKICEQRAGTAESSFVRSHIEAMSEEENNVEGQGSAAMLHAAGTDTIWVTLTIFILAMVLHPECQRRAQEELDAVLGAGRLPEFRDRPSLPYVEAILQETLRQAAPLGLPHVSLEDDMYNGMLITKGSIVIANIRSITLDENIYHKPTEFIPERFLPQPTGGGEPAPPVYGCGQRICPGRHFGDNSIWIAIATILAAVTITKAVGQDGEEITPEVRFKSTLLK
ncbi:hypothetical protein H0H81_004736 [Sphagnurus paluster]|uniref:Cytochrome P450 n=1 Tax=Sphagnurus paluster TaxID=117069 RepID=A0A9P7GPA6_9AGAR|nr:hypothetical protein H0H81_004736 [Sphagnurus paluster]